MARPPRWMTAVQAAKSEALTAVDLYNRPRGDRGVEGFLVHMHIGWLYLLQAEFQQAGIDYRYRQPGSRRYIRVDGDPKTWDLNACVAHRWPDKQDPVRLNLELTIGLRNKIEHRPTTGVKVAAAGFFHSLLMNFEEELVLAFGPAQSVAAAVHVPISLSTFSREGLARLTEAQRQLPQPVKDFFLQARAAIPETVAADRRFELRIDIVQKRARGDDADLAITFVREEDLSPPELAAYQELARTGRVILREKPREVANLGLMKPKAVCQRVEDLIPFRFGHSSAFPRACSHFKVRPPGRAKNPAATNSKYCVYDDAHSDYTYTAAFVDLLVERCSTAAGFKAVTGLNPRAKPSGSDA